MNDPETKPRGPGLRHDLFVVIFEAETSAGKAFDIVLLLVILASILIVMLESVAQVSLQYGDALRVAEWVVTIVFTVEYILRIYCCEHPRRYIFSFYGIIDFISVIPTYLSLFIVGPQYLVVVRSIRLLRVFRVMKLAPYLGEAEVLKTALHASRAKITVFLTAVLAIVVIIGALMHIVEGPENGFTSIPKSMYWAIVTLTTVGYGDIAPQTIVGQLLAALLMTCGYGIIAIPTGIVSVELAQAKSGKKLRACPKCSFKEEDIEAIYCRKCGTKWDMNHPA